MGSEIDLLTYLEENTPVSGRPGPDWVLAREAAEALGSSEPTMREKLKALDVEHKDAILGGVKCVLWHIPGISARL